MHNFKITVIIAIFALITNAYAVDKPSREKNILLLHSYHQGLEWTDNITGGVLNVFGNRPDINLSIEYLDTKRNYSNEYNEALLSLYEAKSHQTIYDAIIVSDNDAYNFASLYLNELYTKVPVFFCGINNLDTLDLENHSNFYGIGEKADYASTIESMIKIFPNRKNVLIINDETSAGKNIQAEVDAVLPGFKNRLNFEIVSDFTLESLREKVKKLDDSYLIYLLVINRDKNNRFISYHTGIKEVKSASNVPIFGSWDFYEGKGLFGGCITRGFEQGRQIALLTDNYLNGTNRNPMKFRFLPGDYAFDYNEMQRFGIKKSDLPQESNIINEPENHDLIIERVLIANSVLALLIVVLILQNRARKRNAKKLEELVVARTSELVEMNKKLEEVIEKKDKFFSILAHDLRNQVGSLYMATKMINEALEIPENSTRRKLSNSIVQTAAQTYNLLEDLLYWAIRQFKKDVAIMKVKTDVNRIILDLSDTFRLNNDNIAIQCNLCPNADIVSDRQILGFIIRNIVHNAIKYSFKNGHIIIATSRTNGSIRISVRDFGVGMSPEIVNSIYAGTPIRKEGKTIATTTGLGLSTALEFLKMLNGSIQINSAPNEGTEFIVLLQKMEEDNMADSNS